MKRFLVQFVATFIGTILARMVFDHMTAKQEQVPTHTSGYPGTWSEDRPDY